MMNNMVHYYKPSLCSNGIIMYVRHYKPITALNIKHLLFKQICVELSNIYFPFGLV